MSLAISTAFAYALPLSGDAVKAVQLRANRRLCGDASARRDRYVTLNFATLLGRRCLSFGSSRSNEFLLPQTEDVAARQFIIYFELHTATLLLTDTSRDGTWLSNESTPMQCLHQAAYPLLKINDIGFGHGQRYRFRILVVDSAIDPTAFSSLFQRYAQSIGQKNPRLTHKLTAALSALNDSFISLHKVGRGKYENVNTCLRLSDGVLFAAKKPSCTSVVGDDGRNVVSYQLASKEAQLLNTKHPNIVRLIDQLRTLHGPVFIFEFVPTSLAAVIDGLHPKGMEAVSVQALLRQCLHAVKHLHERGIRHNGLRPESILVQSVDPFRVKICNFSAADRFSPSSSGAEYGVEAASRKHFFGSDIWALGLLTLTALGCSVRDPRARDHSASDWDPWSSLVEIPDFQHLPCASLLAGMLHINPSCRLNAADCLQDPWLRRSATRKRARSNSEPDDLPPAKRPKRTVTTVHELSWRKGSHTGREGTGSRVDDVSRSVNRQQTWWSWAFGWFPQGVKSG